MMDAYWEANERDERHYSFEIRIQPYIGHGIMAKAHYHECIEILYGQKGSFEALLDGHTYSFGVGDMVLIPAFEPHMMTAISKGENRYLVLKFYPEILFSKNQTLQEMNYLNAFSGGARAYQKLFLKEELMKAGIPGLLDELLEEYDRQEMGVEFAIRTILCRLVLGILRHWHYQGYQLLNATIGSGESFQMLQEVIDYVECNYSNQITLETVARKCKMGYSAFSKFFSRQTGKNFVDYLTEVRLSKAKIMLATTDLSITEIALEAGFSTSSYFISLFKKWNETTPRQFRQQFKGYSQ
ncbi:AraC family transcriptional regulator [Lachnospiraceae bacterium OttesenSCG-928-D06]|nr:AraC family transcriptional regulator [Lachnospiraceae bacterium OttesenSCG-928-D06]